MSGRERSANFAAAFGAKGEAGRNGDNTEAEQELAAALQIRSIPTIMAFRDGVLLFSQPGALPAAALEDLIGKITELDMDEVRATIAAGSTDTDA